MPTSWADLRLAATRATGLVRRGLASVRQRGVAATIERVRERLRPAPAEVARRLYMPAADDAIPALSTCDAPRASIVIPVYDQLAHTRACLRALAEHPPATPHEVIVVDDGSRDATSIELPQVPGLRFHRRVANGGFIAACNDGAAVARGEFVVFLNNDTVPQPGWLEALLDTFDTFPDTGLAGARLVYPDGRLQEAGGLVFRDGSGWNYGRFGAPDDPRYAFVRETDYCSGAALAVPRALFDAIGGFDARYAPAYYEDTDLAFAVRARGLTVRYQPASVVVHCEGITSGTDPTRGAKAYQTRNRAIFAAKWAAVLATHAPPGTDPDLAACRGQRAVLVVDEYVPDPTRDSGSLRLVNLLRLMRDEGLHVTFVALTPAMSRAPLDALRAMGIEAWDAPATRGMASWLRRHGRRFDAAWLCRHGVARALLPALRALDPTPRIIFDTVDLHYLRERRAAEVAGDARALRAAERTRRLELDIVRASDVTLVVSPVERDLLAADAAGACIEVVTNVHRVAGPGQPFAHRRDLVFVGGFRHPPNVDAMLWFAREVWPRVRAHRSDVVLHCIGADAPPEIRALDAVDGIRVHGHVPDIDPFMDGARIAVAPLRFGAGVKGKVNLSMAHGQPVVATSCAVEGMHLRDGEDVLVADDPQAFADALLRLYDDEALWMRLSRNGLANVQRHFSADAAREAVRRSILGPARDDAR